MRIIRDTQIHPEIIKNKLEKLGGNEKNLICIISTSHCEHYDMAKILIKSLRKFGEYKDEILVITDNHREFSKYDVSTIEPKHVFHPAFLKMYIDEHIDVGKYSKIMVLDDDIICENKITNYFNEPTNDFVYYESTMNINKPFFSRYFNHRDLFLLKDFRGINSGQYIISRDSIYTGTYDIWRSTIFNHNDKIYKWWYDQPSLNYIIRSGLIKSTKGDDSFVSFRYDKKGTNILRHYAGFKNRLDIMSRKYDELCNY